MMLDIADEKLIPLTAIPALLAERGFRSRYGRPVALRTVQGWASSGKLDCTPSRCGGVRHTTLEALERMLRGGSGEAEREETGGAKFGRRRRHMTTKRQAQAHAEAEAEAAKLGI